ncbi:hypothetical protein [Acinetobacter towneri]|uniref:hypothetical protein n=1 Tax=Acinetobacter towneri TaxID=202956 RepID=UPI00188BF3D8|nr:hypothetical protein [Acinetobacter towneri]
MPLLASIDTGNSNIDMSQLTQVLPTVVGSVTTLVSAVSSAGSGNITETVADVLKGVNPLLNILANSDILDTDQAEIVSTLYDVLNGVQVVLDFVNNPSLLTLSSDLNNVISALEPIVALIDPEGQLANGFDLGGLLNNLNSNPTDGFSLDSLTDGFDQLISGADLNLGDLLQGASSNTSSDINLDQLIPTLGDALGGLTAGTASDTQFDLATLPNLVQNFDLNNAGSLF